jgi:hypothetical protein
MKMHKLEVLALSVFLGSWLAITGVSQSPSQSVIEVVGEIITDNDQVRINGAPAQRGSTIFNGNEIQTADGSAFVTFTANAGVLSIGPDSRVKVSRQQGNIIAEVFKGTVTVRSRVASTVIAPDRVISSEPNNLYTVSIADSGTVARSLMKSLLIKTAAGVTHTIAAQATEALASAAIPSAIGKPNLIAEAKLTPGQGCFLSVQCVTTGNMVMASGTVLCDGNPVSGTIVTGRVFFRDRTISKPVAQVTNAAGEYKISITNDSVAGGGTAVVTINNCGQCRTRTGNRCSF